MTLRETFPTAGSPSNDVPPMRPAGGQRHAYADVLRTTAAFAVVMIHVAGQGVVHLKADARFSQWVAIFFDALCRWSVPAFVMVSGALILGSTRRESIRDFYLRRATRIGIPLVVWSILYLLWRRYYLPEPDLTLPKMWRAVFFGIPGGTLYFLYLIFGLYLFTPMFRTFVRHASLAEVWTITILALVFTAVTHQIRMEVGGYITWGAFDYFVPYVGYYLAGYAITATRLPAKWEQFFRVVTWVMFPLSVAVATCGVGFTKGPQQLHKAVEIFYQYPYPTVMVMTLSIFSIVHDLYRDPGPIRRRFAAVCSWIAPATLGIYLLHFMGLWEVFKYHGLPVHPNTLIAVPAWTVALFVASLIATKLLQLVPVVRRAFG